MANTLYDTARKGYLEGQFNWLSDTIKCILVSSGYAVQTGTHQYLSDISTSAIVAPAVVLSGKSTNGGAADANDVTFLTVAGSTVTAIILYVDTGTAATSPLLAYIDTATGLPITPNGGDIIVTWDNGANKIYKV
ncbi:hypothetical protein HYG93_07400 [Acinetobacter sp. SwsAc6]|uniref:hypothetical protein n=1 Tax=Acinetobacter sp. SwsAc6 TaxID=2749439 RepID=UPI0015C087A4|nr:hypothetical protein [Acinetobacter sp. SwsAc6]NWK74114.1 hypothetical protein [Acinetobacter sp. SwsAc6]